MDIPSPMTEADTFFRLVSDSLPSGVLVAGPDGTIAIVNTVLERQFGYARDELIGQSIDILLPEAVRPAHEVSRQGFIGTPETRAMGAGRDLFGRRRDGSEFPVEIGLNPVITTHGTFTLAVIADPTRLTPSLPPEPPASHRGR